MPTINIDGRECDFEPGQTILQIANANGVKIPQYCYHDGLSIVASCRICLAEVWAPNPRNDNKLEPIPKLLPTCQTTAAEGQVVYTDSPKAIANQKAVMEYLLINHPLDCPVCDQAGECELQDYSYEYGRGVSRFEEIKVKQPKKDLGPHVYLYSDRCIMCSRCVRFTREVSGTAELMVEGRGNQEQIDVFPGVALDNELSANVIDLCPVGALLDKDFLFTQRVWFLKTTPSIDGTTAAGDNVWIEHNEGRIYRFRPRDNMDVNKWWISDEIRYSWKFAHREDRIVKPKTMRYDRRVECEYAAAYEDAVDGLRDKRVALIVSPMLTCEEAYLFAKAVRQVDQNASFVVGPVPRQGDDKEFPGGYTIRAEKAPNARGVRRVLEAMGGGVMSYEEFLGRAGEFGGLLITGNYPSEWVTDEMLGACEGKFVVLIDTLPTKLSERADVLIPGATWTEKAGVFENVDNRLQAFEQAIPVVYGARQEGQVALDLAARAEGIERPEAMNAANVRREMANEFDALHIFETDVHYPSVDAKQEPDVEMVEL
ncbi:2Fe-2S iron-sulfur cluster-binding protein [Pyruvatibacter sp.]|uniref:2Fe-2S iron-sulfur cluster-binding protein n=1 Tax=Pyruvatibacter sp. TaxID=1981328 RepID=UPI0032ED0014